MPSGLCAQCGPSGAKKLRNLKQISKVKLYLDRDGKIVYLCSSCAKELGFSK